MDDAVAKTSPDEQLTVPETPEDVAILYSWANMPGARYRDFSASRREYRAQQRAKIAERQRQAELDAARELEATAQREFQQAQRIRDESRKSGVHAAQDAVEQTSSYELIRRVEEQALREREEAQRRQQSAEQLRLQAQRARAEMLDARKRAEEQAARYAEAAAEYHDEVSADAHGLVPGETTDPYYYTGQVDPAYFAPTPGVRTAQATRISTERRAYVYPMHPGSEDHDAGTLQPYRKGTTFAPSPSQSFHVPGDSARENQQRQALSDPSQIQPYKPIVAAAVDAGSTEDGYYDGNPVKPAVERADGPSYGGTSGAAESDLLIRPVARTPEPITPELEQVPEPIAEPVVVPQEAPQAQIGSIEVSPAGQDDQAPYEAFGEKLAALEHFAQESELFVPPALGMSGEIQIPAFLASTKTKAETKTPLPANKPARASLAEKTEGRAQFRRRDVPPDSRIRTARQRQTDYPRSESQDVRFAPQVPPAWPEPDVSSTQKLDPERIRTAVTARSARPGGRPFSRYAGVLVENRKRNNRMLPPHLADNDGMTGSVHQNPVDPQEAFRLRREELRRTRLDRQPKGPTPDTLQQSRERVAARWFALQGRMESSYNLDSSSPLAALRVPTLCVMSLSGGVGKTSIVATLGRALSLMGEKILLADLNPHGLLPYYFGARDLAPGTIRTFTPPGGGVDAPVLLTKYESQGMDNDPALQRRVFEDIGRLARRTQRIVVDLGTDDTWLARSLARISPWILVPIAPDMNSVVTTKAMERQFSGVVGADGHPVRPHYILNQFDPGLPLHLDVREVLRQSLGDRLLSVMLHRSSVVSEALAEGMTVVDYAPGAAVTEDYINLANWLRNVSAAGPGAAVPGAAVTTGWRER